ncbi:MAG: tyrosine-type recombinase/integrase [Chitinispirillales bacterium]|nr:tyrosine-type recombinase/integrase [Chitinispirillales bacterium]
MGITKVGPNKWKVTVSFRDKNKGYPVSKQATVTGTRAEATEVEVELLKKLKARSLKTAHVSTFGEATGKYVHKMRVKGVSSSHIATAQRIARDLGHIRLEEFADRFETYIDHFACTPTKHGGPPAGVTINRYIATVKAMFNHLIDIEVVEKNPITKGRFPMHKVKARDRYLTPEERAHLFSIIRKHRPYILPIVQYMSLLPCRVNSELTIARREQYLPMVGERGTIRFPDSKSDVPIDRPVPPGMEEYFRNIPVNCPWLFYREMSVGVYVPLSAGRLDRAWRHCRAKAGMPDLRIHDLRHVAVTDLHDAGNPIQVIMALAGWKTDMLSTYYKRDSARSASMAIFGQEAVVVSGSSVQCRYNVATNHRRRQEKTGKNRRSNRQRLKLKAA